MKPFAAVISAPVWKPSFENRSALQYSETVGNPTPILAVEKVWGRRNWKRSRIRRRALSSFGTEAYSHRTTLRQLLIPIALEA